MSGDGKKPKAGGALTIAGCVVSAGWIAFMGVFAWHRWAAIATMAPNEVGDFLAGVFAPLAFLWLVLGFFQQGRELQHSGEALWLQGQELRNSVEQQRELVNVTREQMILETDRLRQEAVRARALAQPKLDLTLGGWIGSGRGRNQTFFLTNHGQDCTRLRLAFNIDWPPIEQPRLSRGERVTFGVEVYPAMPPMLVNITYLDGLQEPGEMRFSVSFEGDDPSISWEPAQEA